MDTEGVVLALKDGGEADVRVDLFTEQEGKLRCVARSAKKPHSRIAPYLAVGNRIRTRLVRGRRLILTTTRMVQAVDPSQPSKLETSHALCELTGKMLGENDPHPRVYRALCRGLEADETATDVTLIAFMALLLREAGYAPHVEGCVRCGGKTGPFGLSQRQGGLTCGRCGAAPPLSPAAATALRRLFTEGKIALSQTSWLLDTLRRMIEYRVEGPILSLRKG